MSSAAKPIGKCPTCSGVRYEGLVHHCPTTFTPRASGVVPAHYVPFRVVIRDGKLVQEPAR